MKKVLAQTFPTFLLIVIVLIPDLYFAIASDMPLFNIAGHIMIPFLAFTSLIILFTFNLWYYHFFLSIIAIGLVFTATSYVYLYNDIISVASISAISNSTWREVIDFMGGYYVLIGLVHFGLSIVIYYALRSKPISISFWASATISVMSLLLIIAYAYRSSKINKCSFETALTDFTLKSRFPFYIYDAYQSFAKMEDEIKKMSLLSSSFTFHAQSSDSSASRKIHVLIIGETSRYDRWGINGYFRNTSPLLSEEKNLISFSNAITGSGLTQFSVPLIISNTDATDFYRHAKEKCISTLFKEVGYSTYWLSNQLKTMADINLHVQESDSILHTNQLSMPQGQKHPFDGDLLTPLQKIIQSSEDNLFLILHTSGSHWKYDTQYPAKFDYFQPSTFGKFVRLDDYTEKEQILNSYDNSILYTDYIISSIIRMIKKESCISSITYVSDHGENLYDDNKNLFGHGRAYTQYSAPVPLFIWVSDSLKKHYPQKIENLKNNLDLKVSTATHIFPTLASLANIDTYDQCNPQHSLTHSSLLQKERVILNGRLNPAVYKFDINSKKLLD